LPTPADYSVAEVEARAEQYAEMALKIFVV